MKVVQKKKLNIWVKILLVMLIVVIAGGTTFAWLTYVNSFEHQPWKIADLKMFVFVANEDIADGATVLPGEHVLSTAYVSRHDPDRTNPEFSDATLATLPIYVRFRVAFDLIRLTQTLEYDNLICKTENCDNLNCDYSNICPSQRARVQKYHFGTGEACWDYNCTEYHLCVLTPSATSADELECTDPYCEYVHLCSTCSEGCDLQHTHYNSCTLAHNCTEDHTHIAGCQTSCIVNHVHDSVNCFGACSSSHECDSFHCESDCAAEHMHCKCEKTSGHIHCYEGCGYGHDHCQSCIIDHEDHCLTFNCAIEKNTSLNHPSCCECTKNHDHCEDFICVKAHEHCECTKEVHVHCGDEDECNNTTPGHECCYASTCYTEEHEHCQIKCETLHKHNPISECPKVHVCTDFDCTMENCDRLHFCENLGTCGDDGYGNRFVTGCDIVGCKKIHLCRSCGKAHVYDEKIGADELAFNNKEIIPGEFKSWFESLNTSVMTFYTGKAADMPGNSYYQDGNNDYKEPYGWTSSPYNNVTYYYLIKATELEGGNKYATTNTMIKVKSNRKYLISKAIAFPDNPDYVFSFQNNYDVTFNLKIICQTIQANYLYYYKVVDGSTVLVNVGDEDNKDDIATIMNSIDYGDVEDVATPAAYQLDEQVLSFTMHMSL